MMSVYEVTCSIPSGRVTTYGAIADYLGLGSARMVGWALKNASSTTQGVPAHKVVNRKGFLSGRLNFSHPTMMEQLLKAEGVQVKNNIVVDFDSLFWHPSELLDHKNM